MGMERVEREAKRVMEIFGRVMLMLMRVMLMIDFFVMDWVIDYWYC
jgi:hypothetical protein